MGYIVARDGVRLRADATYKGCRIVLDQRPPDDEGWTRVVDYLVPPTERHTGLAMARFFGGSDEKVLSLSVNDGGILEFRYDEQELPPYELSLKGRSVSIALLPDEVVVIFHMFDEFFDGGYTPDTYGAGEDEDDLRLPATIVEAGASVTKREWLAMMMCLRVAVDLIDEVDGRLRIYSEKEREVNLVLTWLKANGYMRARVVG